MSEPHQQPQEPLEIRIGDGERQQVADRLSQAYAEGRLTLEEFSERTASVWAARTNSDVAPLIADLPAVGSSPTPVPASTLNQAATSTTVAIMGGRELKGRWRPARRNLAVMIMGGVEIDLREAELTGPVIEFTLLSIMGGGSVTVPEGVRVESSGFCLMGGRNDRIADVPPVPGMPVIRIRAFALMGGFEIRSKKPRKKG